MKKLIVFLFRIKKTELHYETLANPKPRRGLQRVYKISVFVGLLLLSANLKAQDTIYCSKAKIAKYVVINRKTGIKKPYGRHWIDVDSGYVVKLKNGNYIINGKEMFADKNYKLTALK